MAMQIEMTDAEFTVMLNERISSIQTILNGKKKEYATEQDRMHNFNQAAQIENSTPIDMAWAFLMKHFVSVQDIVKGFKSDVVTPRALVKEKIGDLINYLIIIEALLWKDAQIKTSAKRTPEIERE
jgi:hypothetical protein